MLKSVDLKRSKEALPQSVVPKLYGLVPRKSDLPESFSAGSTLRQSARRNFSR
jgi:hypothetical protein